MLLYVLKLWSLQATAAFGLLFLRKGECLFELLLVEFIFEAVLFDSIFQRSQDFKITDHLDDQGMVNILHRNSSCKRHERK